MCVWQCWWASRPAVTTGERQETRANVVGMVTTTTLTQPEVAAPGCTEQLARFFPDAEPVQVRVLLTPLRTGAGKLSESVLVEFASPERAIFTSTLPLEFDDRVRLRCVPDGGESDATVVAVQYHDGRKAIAVQFVSEQCDWVMRP